MFFKDFKPQKLYKEALQNTFLGGGGGQFSGGQFSWGAIFLGGNFPRGTFSGGIFPRTYVLIFSLFGETKLTFLLGIIHFVRK